MTTFTIDSDNNITAHTATPASADGDAFNSEKQLAKLAAEWPGARVVEIWNSLAGVTPVKKFTNRNVAIGRIWKQIQSLAPAAPAPRSKKAGGGKAPARARKAHTARQGSKKAEVLGLMGRTNGATLTEIMEATGWQAHTVRGFVAGTLKKMGVAVESSRRDDERVYRVKG